MKKVPEIQTPKVQEMAAEYRFDYKKAKPNRFVSQMKNEPLIVMVDPDIAKVFRTSEEVNKALRALISAMPEKKVKAVVK